MTTRYTARSKTRFDVPGLPSGYDSKSAPEITVPSVGIEDVDGALFKLFNEEIPLIVNDNKQGTRRVPVVFFAGEKWALQKKFRALRDKNNSLILPLLTAVRTTLVMDPTSDITGRGINQQTGEIVIHRRLDKSDRAYQGLINRLLLKHQRNVAVTATEADANQLTTLREQGDLADDPVVQQGGLLLPNRKNNIYETIVVPSPRFFTATYEFTLWAQYSRHSMQLLDAIINSQLEQGSCWRIESPKGYWFVATVEGNQFEVDTNTDDFSSEERVIKHKFVVKVPGYILAPSVPGAPVPIKRYVSAPSISFETALMASVDTHEGGVVEPFLGADDPTLPIEAEGKTRRSDQRLDNSTQLYDPGAGNNKHDPALKRTPRGTPAAKFKKVTAIDKNGKLVTKLFRVKTVNAFSGETVLAPDAASEGMMIVLADDAADD